MRTDPTLFPAAALAGGAEGERMEPEEIGRQHTWLKRRARRLMGSRLRSWMESGDLAQETEREAWRSFEGKRFANLRALRGWLLKIMGHLAAKEARRRGLGLVGEDLSTVADSGRTPSRVAAVRDSGRWIRGRLETLSERDRQVVLARIVDDEPFATIAERLGISEGNARVVFHRSLERLSALDE